MARPLLSRITTGTEIRFTRLVKVAGARCDVIPGASCAESGLQDRTRIRDRRSLILGSYITRE